MAHVTCRATIAQREAVTECIAAYVREFGMKCGLPLAAEAIGMGERAARHALHGGEFRADAERAARADQARLNLLITQIADLHAQAEQIKAKRRGLHVGTPRPSMDDAGDILCCAGASLLPARGALT